MVRRLKAILLLALFAVSLITTVTGAAADAKLPPCCRRGGKHHCAMSAGQMEMDAGSGSRDPGPLLSRRQIPCPLFPKTGALPTAPRLGLPVPAQLAFAIAPEVAPAPAGRHTHARLVLREQQGERGPPHLLPSTIPAA